MRAAFVVLVGCGRLGFDPADRSARTRSAVTQSASIAPKVIDRLVITDRLELIITD